MYVNILVLTLVGFSAAAEKDSTCTTPNGDIAKCVPIAACPPIKNAIQYLDQDAVEFARQSQCGYDDGPLVCCGPVGRVTTVPPPSESTKPQYLTNPKSIPSHVKHLRLPDSSLCGLQSASHNNNELADIDEYPWMVALYYLKNDNSPGGFLCSGTLINQRYVLTAAQCLNITGYKLTQIRVGEWNFSSPNDCHKDYQGGDVCSEVQNLPITEKIIHPFYSTKSGNNNIALLRVENKIRYDDYIRPICLPPSDNPPPSHGTLMESSGWGLGGTEIKHPVKIKLEIPMVGPEQCDRAFPNYTHYEPNQACIESKQGKDPCIGDSGAPLLRMYIKEDETDQHQWFQEGVIYRKAGCEKRTGPVQYTKVSSYINWIINNLKAS